MNASTKKFIAISLGLMISIGAIGYLLLLSTVPTIELFAGQTFSVANLWALLVLAYAIFSYRFWDQVDTDESAALTFFGRPIADVEAGAPYAPLFIIQIKRVTAQVIQMEFPADPQHIYRGDMKSGEELPNDMKPPIRVQFRDSITEEQANKLFTDSELRATDVDGHIISFVVDAPDDGLARRLTAEPYPVVRFLVKSPSLFLRNIGTIKEALKQIEDEMFSVLTRFYPRMSVGQALQNIKWMNIHLFESVAQRVGARGTNVKPWGIELQAAYVKYIYTDHGVNSAISGAARAPFERETVVVTAEGERKRLILEGEGKAKAAEALTRQTLEGRAAGLAEIARILSVSGQEAQAADVARAVAEGGNTFVVGDGGMAQIAAIAAAFNKERNKPNDATDTNNGTGGT